MRPMNGKLPVKSKLAYGLGDFGYSIAGQTVTMFLVFFFTDVFGIPPAAAGTVLLVAKLWDAVSDPMMGSIVDKTRTRWGSKRPWILFGAVPFGISFWILFAGPALSPAGRVLYAGAAFILFCTTQTVVNIPYCALTVSMTEDADERSSITAWRMSLALVGTLIAGAAAPVIVKALGGGLAGWRSYSAIGGAVGAFLYIVCFLGVEERNFGSGEKVRFLANLKSVFINKPFLVLAASTLVTMTALNILAAVVPYYFTYNLREPGLVAAGLGILLGSAVLFMPLLGWLSGRIGKARAYMLALAEVVAVILALRFVGERSIPLALGLFALAGFGVGSMYLYPWSIVADTIEYSQWKTGIRPEGALYGYFTFVFKVGTALSGFIIGIVLELFGYVPNVAQSARGLEGIRLLLSFIPAALFLVGIALLSRYGIDKATHARYVDEIARGIHPGAAYAPKPEPARDFPAGTAAK